MSIGVRRKSTDCRYRLEWRSRDCSLTCALSDHVLGYRQAAPNSCPGHRRCRARCRRDAGTFRLCSSIGDEFDGRMWQMAISENARSAEAIRRKLRSIAAVLLDPAATEHERANAETLKMRLEKQLRQEASPEGTWTDIMFRLGRAVKEIKQSTSPASPKGDWTDHAFRLGRTLRRGFKK